MHSSREGWLEATGISNGRETLIDEIVDRASNAQDIRDPFVGSVVASLTDAAKVDVRV
jgi:hypothetical protein